MDTNDVDIQSSSSIADSKRNGIFICEYKVLKSPKAFKINEAWREKLWTYEITTLFKRSIKLDSANSNIYLQLSSLNDSLFSVNNIFEKWELVNDSTNEVAGSIQGRLDIYHNNRYKIDSCISLTLIVNPHSETRDTIGKVLLKSIPLCQ